MALRLLVLVLALVVMARLRWIAPGKTKGMVMSKGGGRRGGVRR